MLYPQPVGDAVVRMSAALVDPKRYATEAARSADEHLIMPRCVVQMVDSSRSNVKKVVELVLEVFVVKALSV